MAVAGPAHVETLRSPDASSPETPPVSRQPHARECHEPVAERVSIEASPGPPSSITSTLCSPQAIEALPDA
jgi:hypothetical protein